MLFIQYVRISKVFKKEEYNRIACMTENFCSIFDYMHIYDFEIFIQTALHSVKFDIILLEPNLIESFKNLHAKIVLTAISG